MNYLRHVFQPDLLFGALGTIALLSLVFRENKAYRLFEHIFIGLALGYEVEQGWTNVLRPQLWDPVMRDGQWIWVAAVPVCLMLYAAYVPKIAWLSRVVYGLFFGLTSGTIFQETSQRFVPQIVSSFKPIFPSATIPHDAYANLHRLSFTLNNLLFIAILISVLTYFFFAFDNKNRIVAVTAKSGRMFLMIAFGAMFGGTVMTRMALLIDRMYFIFVDWLRLAPR